MTAPAGWATVVPLGRDKRVLVYPNGAVRFEHPCRAFGHAERSAPELRLNNGHDIVEREPLTIGGDIWCLDCGTFGRITAGRWLSVADGARPSRPVPR